MPDYMTIDGGTTNTRISIVSEGKVIDTLRFHVGARAGIDSKTVLRETVKKGIAEILTKNHRKEEEIERVLASGMITSEFGLVCLPHILTPAGIGELHDAMYEVRLEDITSIPFVFLRGVKMNGEDLETVDMMRGEETELMGILKEGADIYILPGSHSKIIKTDSSGRIVSFKTMLTGEMIAALSENTILKDAVHLEISETKKEYLLKGFEYCSKNGINEALFKVRIQKNLFGKTPEEVYSFFMGVILCDEIQYILSQHAKRIVIGGKKAIKEPMAVLLGELSAGEITVISDEEVSDSSAFGMIKIYEYTKETGHV